MELHKNIKTQFDKNPALRVLFFFDESRNYEEHVKLWAYDDIVCIIADATPFHLKYQLENELKEKKVFLYYKRAEPTDIELESFPLADILLANKQLYLDPVMGFIEEYGLDTVSRPAIEKYYQSDLKFQNRKDFLSSILTKTKYSEPKLKEGLLCYHLELKKIADYNIIAAQTFCLALDSEKFAGTIEKLKRLDLYELLLENLNEIFGSVSNFLDDRSVRELICKLKYNTILRTPGKVSQHDTYSRYKEDNQVRLSRLFSFIHDWESDSQTGNLLPEVFAKLGNAIQEERIVEWYGGEINFGYYTEKLLRLVLDDCISQLTIQPTQVKQTIRRWFEEKNNSPAINFEVEYLWNTCSVYELLSQNTNFVYDKPADYLSRYEKELYKVDFYYRKAVDAYDKWQKESTEGQLDKSYKELHEEYERNFVTPLNNEWLKCVRSFNFDFSKIPVSKQYNFYKEKVNAKQQRTAVIISDAFRYESAIELVEVLNKDSKNTTKIESMLASVPSVTSLGMANLLPNTGIEIQGTGFSIDGISTEGTINRTKILKQAKEKSEAIDFNELIKFDQEKGREFFKNNEIVYIYHNQIDSTGEKIKTERKVYDAVLATVEDLALLIRKLNGWNVYRTLVTADHGFLLSIRDIPETMREDMPEMKDEFLVANRVVIANKIKDGSYQFKLSDTSSIKSELTVAIPKSINRYRRQGAGVQYVHGGASLQELIVPVIEYSRMREDVTEKVKLRLVKFDEKISSGYLRANILQLEPVSAGIKGIDTVIGLYSDVELLVSNELNVQFTSPSTTPTERTKEINLTLNSIGTTLNHCYLKGFDVDDTQRLNPLFSQRIMIQTIMPKDEF